MYSRALLIACLLLGGSIVTLHAQQGSSNSQQDSHESSFADFVSRHMPEVDQGDGIHLTKHFAVVFGDIKAGEGIAGGAAVSTKFDNGGFAQLKGEYSSRRFALVQVRYDSPKSAGGHLWFTTRARWQDAPDLDVYELGPASPLAGVEYSERRTELSASGVLRFTSHLRIEAGGAAEQYVINGGELLPPAEEGLTSVPPLPGIGVRPWFQRLSARAIADWRAPEHGYAQSGTFVSASADDYRDWQHHAYSFQAFNAIVEHLVPTFGGRGVLDVTGTAWLTRPAAGSSVPFFLMPTLGGGDYLEGYRLYRFRDRDAILLRGEYRWAVQQFLDLAGVYELGDVASSPIAFRGGDLKKSIAGGVRVHTSSTLVLSLDVAHSHEGFEFNVLFSAPR